MANSKQCLYLRILVKPGGSERHKIENFSLEDTVTKLKSEASNLVNVSTECLELVHHGKVLKDNTTLQDCGIKVGETVHVVKKKYEQPPFNERPSEQGVGDLDLQQIVAALRAFGTTPSAPGWTRALQVLDDDSSLDEIQDAVPNLREDPISMSLLQDMDLVSAIGADTGTLRRAVTGRANLSSALSELIRIVRSNPTPDNATTPGFAYSLEALSEDEDGDDEEPQRITAEQLAAALRGISEAVSNNRGNQSTPRTSTSNTPGSSRMFISPELFSTAINDALSRATFDTTTAINLSPMEQSTPGTPTQTRGGAAAVAPAPAPQVTPSEEYGAQLVRMREMGLSDDSINLRALMLSGGDVNAAINLVFSGAIDD